MLILLNGHHNSLAFKLPALQSYEAWQPIIDTARVARKYTRQAPGATYELQARSMVVMQLKSQWVQSATRKGQEFLSELSSRWRRG